MTAAEEVVVAAASCNKALELGTRKWGLQSTHHRSMFPAGCDFTMTDYLEGDDVDVVSDAHDFKEFKNNSFDGVYSASTFEHIQFPWVAAGALFRIVKSGGWLYVATHHTFPVHGYPYDYTRWTDEGLRSLFEWVGFEVVKANMTGRCVITPPAGIAVWDTHAPAYLGVEVFCRKP
jgi:hypothetical protein